ncbi:oligosaccharide repeat unit polymerase [Luteimonas sp. SJ-92]|uniref:Oligosaccharide repeat unit polymerase n=1 Tax=Luteimonas salinisoli TaxID=2752307 RepID=A0A853JAS4_9GAMM|nr:oligosaccharide repeat unit polymerase [Luteimonas salinisoli]NZA25834.1 oligosaccharide repeat unit polymerase [Luteimonas salinisoli]
MTAFLYLLFFCALSLLAFARLGARLDRMFASPILAFLLGMAFVYGFMPWLKELQGLQTYPFHYAADAKLAALLFSLVFALAALAGYWACGGLARRTLPDIRCLTARERRRALLLVGIPSLLALLYLARTVTGYDLADYMKDRIVIRRGMGPAVILSFAAICYGAILVANLLTEHRLRLRPARWRLLATAATLLLIAAAFVAMGNRNFVFILIAIVLLAALSVRPGRLRGVLVLAPALLAVAVGFSAWAKVRTTLDSASSAAIAGENPVELLVYGLNGAFGNAENLVWLAQHEGDWKPLYGQTVYAALVNPVPRSLWPDKPFGGGPALRNMIYPGSYTLDGEKLTSYTTGLPAEGYMNFGVAGLLLFGAGNGACLALARNLYARRRLVTPLAVVIYSFSIFMFSFGFLYMELLGGWSRYFITVLLLLGVAWLGDRSLGLGAAHAQTRRA